MANTAKIPTRADLFTLPGKRSVGDRTSEKKRLRRQTILRTILLEGPISRAEIARRLGFNPQTVKLVIPELIEEGLILEEQEEPHGQMGRPASPCRMNPDAGLFIGLGEVAGRLSLVALDAAGLQRGAQEEQVPNFTNPAARAAWVADQTLKFYNKLSIACPLSGVALSLDETVPTERETHPGVPVPVAGTLAYLYRRELESRLGVAALVDSKSRMLAIGSRWFGPAKGYDDFCYLDLGSSFRVSNFVGSRLLMGSSGFAGELGEAPAAVAESGPDGPMPRRFDEFLSVTGFQALAREMGVAIDLDKITRKAVEKDYRAKDLFQTYARHLAMPTAILINLFNPRAVVVGGELSRIGDLFMPALQDILYRAVPADLIARIDFLVDAGSTDSLAPARGAVATLLDHTFSTSYAEIIDVI